MRVGDEGASVLVGAQLGPQPAGQLAGRPGREPDQVVVRVESKQDGLCGRTSRDVPAERQQPRRKAVTASRLLAAVTAAVDWRELGGAGEAGSRASRVERCGGGGRAS